MNITDYIYLYLITAVIFTIIDLVWLGKVAPNVYKKYIGHLMADKPNKTAALLFYSSFIVGLLVFVLIPTINEANASKALIYGALYGFFTYATFDLTSHAAFKKWSTTITVIDMVWGTILSASVCLFSYLVYTNIF